MSSLNHEEVENKDLHFLAYYRNKQEEYLKSIIIDEIIEEHRLQPLGQHSEPLERLLSYFRRLPMSEKFAVKKAKDDDHYFIVAFSGIRGVPPTRAGDELFSTIEETYHGIFLKQLNALRGA